MLAHRGTQQAVELTFRRLKVEPRIGPEFEPPVGVVRDPPVALLQPVSRRQLFDALD